MGRYVYFDFGKYYHGARKNLRSKLSKVCGDIVIATVWGRGYKFER